jgi:hypothetical protein
VPEPEHESSAVAELGMKADQRRCAVLPHFLFDHHHLLLVDRLLLQLFVVRLLVRAISNNKNNLLSLRKE